MDQCVRQWSETGRRNQSRFGFQVGQILHDGRTFGQQAVIVQHKRRDIAFGIYPVIVAAVRNRVGFEIDFFQRQSDAGFAGDNVRRQRTGAGRIIELHKGP